MDSINALFVNLLTLGTNIALATAAFFVLIGGFIYMTAGGSARQMETGKSAIVNALLGLAVVLGARTIVALISSALGGGAS